MKKNCIIDTACNSLILKFLINTIVFFFLTNSINAQTKENSKAVQLIQKNKFEIFKSDEVFDVNQIADFYEVASTGITMIHLQQRFQDLPVFSCMKVLAFKGDSLISVADNYFKIDSKDADSRDSYLIKPERAVLTALNDQSIFAYQNLNFNKSAINAYNLGTMGVSYQDITCELIWVPVNNTFIKLAWQVELAPINTSDHLLIRVDAYDNIVLDKNNYTVYENSDVDVGNYAVNLAPLAEVSNNNGELTQPLSNYFNANYRVIPYPFESVGHLTGVFNIVNNPWQISIPNDTLFKWHYDGISIHDSSKGNNVWAQEDRDYNNSTLGKAALSLTTSPVLNFNLFPDFTESPVNFNTQQFAITNLFYWNNLMHDLLYQYGFDEASGNFQFNNWGMGGIGNDGVIADAQDAGRFNNANFTTPVDGYPPRMQMYLFNATIPFRDADLDNGIIVHEYAHGISNRLTGGPLNSSCLSNAEQAGEGWSDYFSLMMTTNWTASNVQDGALPRPLGTYVLGQSITGRGIRSYPYSTDKTINPLTYGKMAATGGEVHKIGEIWCATLWDMTWNLISLEGINTNIFDPSVVGGNTIALKLVIEGMRLQPCRPGFIDARNAILKADTIFFNAKYSCAIWSAFAGRGMGKYAKQGSSNSTKDQIEDYLSDFGLKLNLRQNVSEQHEGRIITYYNEVKASECFDIVNFVIRDTLPTNADYISGGVFDSISRVVSFLVNQQAGEIQTYPFIIKIKRDAYFAPIDYIHDTVFDNSISDIWDHATVDPFSWIVSSEESYSHPYSLFCKNYGYISDQSIFSNSNFLLPVSSSAFFSFQSYIQSEMNWDGGVVEISIDSGFTWTDLGNSIISGYYNGKINTCGNPLAGRNAFSGNSNGFVNTIIDLSDFVGNSVKIRFRFASDETNFSKGWFLDDIHFVDTAIIKIKSSLSDNENMKHDVSFIVTKILPPLSCLPPEIIIQPDSLNLCDGSSGNFSVTVRGTDVQFQWQISTDGGHHFQNIIGENDSVLNITIASFSMNFNLYRCIITSLCSTEIISKICKLTVYGLPTIDSIFPYSRCGEGAVNIQIPVDSNETIDWYFFSNSSDKFTSASFFQTSILTTNTTYWLNKRNKINGCVSSQRTPCFILILSLPDSPIGNDSSICGAGQVSLKAYSPFGTKVIWYNQSTAGNLLDSGMMFRTPIIANSTTFYAASKAMNGCESNNRKAIIAKINPIPVKISIVVGALKCSGEIASITAMSASGHYVRWYADSIGNILLNSASSIGVSNYTTASIQNTTTFWAANFNNISGCISVEKKPVVVVINQRPAAPVVYSNSTCGPGSVTLGIVSPSTNVVYDWYTGSSGGLSISTSTIFNTPIISNSMVYYVESKYINTGCVSVTRSLAKSSVYSIPTPPISLGSNVRCGSGDIVLRVMGNAEYAMDWYSVPTGGIPVKTNSDFLSLYNIFSSNTYYVSSRDMINGCISNLRTKITAAVLPILSAPLSISGIVNICPFVGTANSVLYSTSSVQGALNYLWTLPYGAILDSGSNGLKIRVRYLYSTASDTIRAQANNGCLGLKKTLKLNTNACLFAGLQKQKVALENSSELKVLITPNPSGYEFNIKAISGSDEKISVNIINMQGKITSFYTIGKSEELRFGKYLLSGVYIIECKQGGKYIRSKVIKL